MNLFNDKTKSEPDELLSIDGIENVFVKFIRIPINISVSYTHLRAHETDSYLVCRLLLEKKNN